MEDIQVYERRKDYNLRPNDVQNGFNKVVKAINSIEQRLDSLESQVDEILKILKESEST